MARPWKYATCHPEKKHRALGLCNNCYINSRHRTPEGKAKRHEYYVRNRSIIQQKARDRWRTMHPEIKRVRLKAAAIQSAPRRAVKNFYRPEKPEVPVSALPRETPEGFCDRDWWRVSEKEKPHRWRLGT